ncbi:MAG TPA: acyl carrier protein [Anaerolineales bacterium]|nr:acyl carrier protein [Anaerolineales bacterium]HLE72927.1 acyl carrier protein [Anaerolineales bacterium]
MPSETDESVLMEDLRSLMAGIFHMEASDIGAEAQLGELPQWDSMAHMDLMVALEARFGVELTAETISQLISLPAILGHLHGKAHA